MIQRLPNWEQRLHDYVARLEGTAFAWHDLDCARFGAGVVEAVAGVDLFAPFRGRYRTRIGAARALRRYGAGTLEATIAASLPQCSVAFAQRGDLVMARGMIGACMGARAIFVGDVDGVPGWVWLDRGAWSTAWAVG